MKETVGRKADQKITVIQFPIELTPEEDPNPDASFLCHNGHKSQRTVREKTPYTLLFQGVLFVFPEIWANVCKECEAIYPDNPLAGRMIEEIYSGESVPGRLELPSSHAQSLPDPRITGYLK